MWIARDEDNTLHLFDGEVIRVTNNCPFGYWQIPNGYFNSSMQLNEELFPNLKWEDEPIKINLVSKSIDEDKLDELADSFNYHDKNDRYCEDEVGMYYGFQEGFKTGYRKAMEN